MVSDTPWPAIGHEELIWDPPTRVGLFRSELRDIGRPYDAAVPPFIADRTPRMELATLAMAEEATAAISRFDGSLPTELGGLTAILLRSESASSSQIEQLTASARAVAEAEVTGAGRGNAAVVAANSTAMHAAIALAHRLDADAIEAMQRALLESSAPDIVGWRTETVWIGGGSSTPVTADFVAPQHDRIAPLIADLVSFMRRDDIPVLVQTAIAHAQFETIHPFADGNGRTGRALVHALLRSKGVVTRMTVPLSGGLLRDCDAYIDALDAYRSGHVAPIVQAFARAALRATADGQELAQAVASVRADWDKRLTVRRDSAAWKLLDHLVAHPVMDAALAASLIGVSEQNVHRALRALQDAEIVVARQHHAAHRTLFRAPAILRLLDAYAARAGRRARG